MERSTRRTLLRTVSVFLYFGALVAFTVVGVRGYLALRTDALGAMSLLDAGVLLAGIGFVVGARRFGPSVDPREVLDTVERGGRHRPQPSKLKKLGYRVPTEADDTDRTTTYEDGTLYRVCTECGEHNETDFDFCRRCSSKLER